MVNSVCISWITISMFRMLHSKAKFFSTDNILMMGAVNALVIAMPIFLAWYFLIYPGGLIGLPLFFLITATLHAVLLVQNQAGLKANITAIAETIRGISTLIFMLLPSFIHMEVSEHFYWIVWLSAYWLSIAYMVLMRASGYYFFGRAREEVNALSYRKHLGEIARYGFPFSVWMLFSDLLAYSDRWYLAASGIDKAAAADYLALADSVFRGCGFLFVPLNTSGFPVVSRLYDTGDMTATYKLIIKIVKIEVLLLFIATSMLFLFHNQVFSLLHIKSGNPQQNLTILILLVITHGTWQICAMIQKPAELRMKTGWLAAGNALGTIIAYSLLYLIIRPENVLGILLCLIAGIMSYTLFVSYLMIRFTKNLTKG